MENEIETKTEIEDVSYFGKFKMRNRLFSSANPLWMPLGSIRGIIVLGLVGTAIYCTINHIYLSGRMWDLILGFTSLYIGSRLNFKGKGDKEDV